MRYRVYRIRNGIYCPEYYGIREDTDPLIKYILKRRRYEWLLLPEK